VRREASRERRAGSDRRRPRPHPRSAGRHRCRLDPLPAVPGAPDFVHYAARTSDPSALRGERGPFHGHRRGSTRAHAAARRNRNGRSPATLRALRTRRAAARRTLGSGLPLHSSRAILRSTARRNTPSRASLRALSRPALRSAGRVSSSSRTDSRFSFPPPHLASLPHVRAAATCRSHRRPRAVSLAVKVSRRRRSRAFAMSSPATGSPSSGRAQRRRRRCARTASRSGSPRSLRGSRDRRPHRRARHQLPTIACQPSPRCSFPTRASGPPSSLRRLRARSGSDHRRGPARARRDAADCAGRAATAAAALFGEQLGRRGSTAGPSQFRRRPVQPRASRFHRVVGGSPQPARLRCDRGELARGGPRDLRHAGEVERLHGLCRRPHHRGHRHPGLAVCRVVVPGYHPIFPGIASARSAARGSTTCRRSSAIAASRAGSGGNAALTVSLEGDRHGLGHFQRGPGRACFESITRIRISAGGCGRCLCCARADRWAATSTATSTRLFTVGEASPLSAPFGRGSRQGTAAPQAGRLSMNVLATLLSGAVADGELIDIYFHVRAVDGLAPRPLPPWRPRSARLIRRGDLGLPWRHADGARAGARTAADRHRRRFRSGRRGQRERGYRLP